MRLSKTSLSVALVALAIGCGPRTNPPTEPPPLELSPAPSGRLGDAVQPTEVHLKLSIDPDRPAFRGEVAIDLAVRQRTRSIWLHARHLTIRSATVYPAGGRPMRASAVDTLDGPGLLGVHFDSPLPAGEAQLQIEFSGQFRDTDGLFRQQHAGRWYVYSDFEPVDARRAFPCFDDPRFKVPWSLTLQVPEGMGAFSNMPEAERSASGDTVDIDFQRTTALPSYLISIAVGTFDVVEGATEPVPVRVLAPRGLGRFGKFALDITPAMLRHLESYFDMKTPYPKLDYVAVPRFSGAMENPGLITVAAGILMVDPKRTSESDREFLAGVIAHELSHLWFGDLVTMRWWDDLWLNEAFATWMSERIVGAWKPSMVGRVLEVADRISALREDRWPSGRAIKVHIDTEARIPELFDVITYRKGGAVLGMLESTSDPARTRSAIRDYIGRHAFGNAAAEDVLSVLDENQKQMVGSFLSTVGIPEVAVTIDCSGGNVAAVLEQRPYRLLSAPEPDTRRWHLPVCLRHEGGVDCTVIDEARVRAPLSTKTCPTWIWPNVDGRGYYYVTMTDAGLWDEIAPHATNELEASWLVEAIDAQLHAGAMKPSRAASLLRKLAGRYSHSTNEIARIFFELDVAIDDRSMLATEVESAVGSEARKVGLVPNKGEDRMVHETRTAIVGLAARVGSDVELRKQARRMTNDWLAGGASPPLLGLTLRIAALSGDSKLFDSLLMRMHRDSSRRIDIAIGSALGSFEDPALTRRALELLSSNGIGWQPKLALVSQALLRHEAQDDTVDYLVEHAAELPGELFSDLPRLAASLCTADHRDAVAELMNTRAELPETKKRRTLDHITQCAALHERASNNE